MGPEALLYKQVMAVYNRGKILWFCGCGMICWYVLIWNSCVIIEHFQHSLVNCWIKQKKFTLYEVQLICSASSFVSLFLFSCVTKHFSLPNVKGINLSFLLDLPQQLEQSFFFSAVFGCEIF